jgi:PTS system fructose-specific IIA component/PTS system nitrogen regulatory IIA component
MANEADTPEVPKFPAVAIPLDAAASPENAIRFLVGKLVAIGELPALAASQVEQAVLARESLGSTAVGKGVAVPHGICGMLKRVIGIVGKSSKGIDWETPDGTSVHRICLIVAPVDRPGDHIRALEMATSALRK